MARIFLGTVLGLMSATSVSAATVYEINATAAVGSVSDFDLTYEDVDGDMLFSLDELISFSGVTFNSGSFFIDTLTGVPSIADVADGGESGWSFSSSGGGSGSATVNNWTYGTNVFDDNGGGGGEGPVPAVPLPASGLLLFGALFALRRFAGRPA